MFRLGGDLREWREDEAALVHRRVRDRQFGSVYNHISEQKNIDIDRSWTFLLNSLSSHRFLDVEDLFHHLGGSGRRLKCNDAVQKPRLIGELYRLGFIRGRN